MTGFGDDLKRERESRGITLESLEAETRVKLRYLQLVEQEEFAALPGGLFRRGIVKAYLTAVGLEEVAWLLRFDSALDVYERGREASSTGSSTRQDSWVAFAQNVKRNRAEAPRSGRAKTIGLLVLLLVVAGAGWAVWVFVLRPRLER